jgi:hypothetical protein
MKKKTITIEEMVETNDIGLTSENVQEGIEILRISIVETDTHVGLLFGVRAEAYEMPFDLKMSFIEGLGEVINQVINEPDETRQ